MLTRLKARLAQRRIDPDAAILAPYHRRSWIQRNRKKCLAALLIFTFFYSVLFTLIGPFLPMPFAVPILVLGLVVLWLLPENDRPPTGLMEKLLFAMIVALMGWPDYLAFAFGNLPWITLMRLTVFPLGFCLLMCVSVSPTFRREMAERLNAVKPAWIMLAGITILGLLTIPLSSRVSATTNRFVILLFYWVVPFFAAVWVFARPKRIVWLAHTIWGLAVFVCLIGIWEWRYSRVPWAGRVPSFLKIEDESVQRILSGSARAATGIYRVQSKFTTSLGLAEFISYALPFIVHIALTTRSQIIRVLSVGSIPLILFINVKTDSRIGFIGMTMTILLYGLGWALLRWRRNADSVFAPATVLAYPAVMVMTILSTFFVPRMRAQVWGNGPQAASNETRRQMYEQGIPMILKQPWGHGLGEGALRLGFYNGNGILTIDTYWIAVGLELGLLGFILYYGLFGLMIWRIGRAIAAAPDRDTLYLLPIGIVLCNFFVIKSVFSQVENHPMIFTLLGAGAALLWRVYEAVPSARPGRAPAPMVRGGLSPA